MTLSISNQAIEVSKVAQFLADMDGCNKASFYQSLIEASAEKQAWIEKNFVIAFGDLDVADLDIAFSIIEK